MFQTSTANDATQLGVIGNGSSGRSDFIAYANSEPTNTAFISISSRPGAVITALESGITGTGVYLPMTFYTSGSERLRIATTSGNVGIGLTSPTGKLDVAGTIKTLGYTVATLPTGVTGARAYVTNALAPTFGATVVTGGAVTIPVFYNGTNWIVG
jgi:hypothetical protein